VIEIIDGQRVFVQPDLSTGFVEVDVQTRREGNSAFVVLHQNDIKVAFGPLHAEVRLKDLGVCVTMNPDPGEWTDPVWARSRAIEVVVHPRVLPLVLPALVKLHFERGRRDGRDEIRKEMRKLIGVSREHDESY
jgi:hypothetical protein